MRDEDIHRLERVESAQDFMKESMVRIESSFLKIIDKHDNKISSLENDFSRIKGMAAIIATAVGAATSYVLSKLTGKP